MLSKRCSYCNKIKALDEFGKHAGHRDGRVTRCKLCTKKIYQENREYYLEIKRKYRRNEKNREKELQAKKVYRQSNKEKILEYNKVYCRLNPEWAKKQARLYYWRNRGKRLIKVKEYKRNNRALYNELDRKRRSIKENLPTTLTKEEWSELLECYSYRCYYCRKKVDKLQKEHKIPLSRGGGYTKDNIVPACKSCNSRKHTLTESEFRERQMATT